MSLLCRAGFIKRFPRPEVNPTGRPEYIYCSGKKNITRGSCGVRHGLAVSEVETCFTCWMRSELELTGKLLFPWDFHLRLSIIPDAAFLIGKAGKKLLYFLEVDLGTESLTGTDYAFQDKISAYGEYFDTGRYRVDFENDGEFRGFRVAVIVDSERRLANILNLAKDAQADFIVFKTLQLLKEKCFPIDWITITTGTSDLLGRQEKERGST
jgi:hypothetical protein